MADWFYQKTGVISDDTIGPIDNKAIVKKLQRGELHLTTLVMSPQATKGQWYKVASLPKLAQIIHQAEEKKKTQKAAARDLAVREREQKRQEKLVAREVELARKRQRIAELKKRELENQRKAIAEQPRPVAGQLVESNPTTHQPVIAPSNPFRENTDACIAAHPPQSPQPQNVHVHYHRHQESNAAAVLVNALIFPGVGQLMQGRAGAGIFLMLAWFFSWVFGFAICIGFLGLPIIWLVAVIDAACYRPPR